MPITPKGMVKLVRIEMKPSLNGMILPSEETASIRRLTLFENQNPI
jgi:hypothetical protein